MTCRRWHAPRTRWAGWSGAGRCGWPVRAGSEPPALTARARALGHGGIALLAPSREGVRLRRDTGDRWSEGRSEIDHHPEAAPEHAFAIERQRFGVGHRGQARVGHHLLVDAVALRARLVDDPGEDHRLVGLELDRLRERSELAGLHVVGDALAIFQRAVFAPDLAGLARHAPVCGQVLLRNGQYETVDITHGNLLLEMQGREAVSIREGAQSASLMNSVE